MAERDPFDWLGHTIDGRFEVTALAGEGGFGVVYRAHHKALNVPVAIKCLKVPKALVGQEREKFERRERDGAGRVKATVPSVFRFRASEKRREAREERVAADPARF